MNPKLCSASFLLLSVSPSLGSCALSLSPGPYQPVWRRWVSCSECRRVLWTSGFPWVWRGCFWTELLPRRKGRKPHMKGWLGAGYKPEQCEGFAFRSCQRVHPLKRGNSHSSLQLLSSHRFRSLFVCQLCPIKALVYDGVLWVAHGLQKEMFSEMKYRELPKKPGDKTVSNNKMNTGISITLFRVQPCGHTASRWSPEESFPSAATPF